MLLLLLFGVITSIITVSGIPVDFDQDEYHFEGFLPNDLIVDSLGNNLPVDNSGVDGYSYEFPTYVFPDTLNPDPFSYMRDKSDVDSFNALPDEPTNEPTYKPAREPTREPTTNDASVDEFFDPLITNLIGESSHYHSLHFDFDLG